MNIGRKLPFAAVALGLVLVYSSLVRAQDSIDEPAYQLRSAYLKESGLHFPGAMPGVMDVMRYQAGLSTHQELSVEWNLLPGSDRPVLRTAVPEGSLERSFSLLDRKQGLKGSSRVSTLTLSDMTLVTAAVSKTREIRGVVIGPGSPLMRAEHGANGQQTGGQDVVFPKTEFILYLPDDPTIDRLVFLMAHPDGEKYRLEQVGILELSVQASPK